MWLSRLSASLQTNGSLVPFLVRAHAWAVGGVPSGGCAKGNRTLAFLSLSLKKKEKEISLVRAEHEGGCGELGHGVG